MNKLFIIFIKTVSSRPIAKDIKRNPSIKSGQGYNASVLAKFGMRGSPENVVQTTINYLMSFFNLVR